MRNPETAMIEPGFRSSFRQPEAPQQQDTAGADDTVGTFFTREANIWPT